MRCCCVSGLVLSPVRPLAGWLEDWEEDDNQRGPTDDDEAAPPSRAGVR